MSTTPHSGSDERVRQEYERTKSEAAHLASSAAESAQQRGEEALDRAKEQAADRADELAAALESTADDLESRDGEEALSGYGRSMAEMMRHFAGGLREHEIEEFAGQLARFARRSPASFLAGSVALGFGVSRFLKASSTRPHEEYGYDDEDEYLLESDEEDFGGDSELAASEQAGYAGTSAGRGAGTWPEDRGRERPGAGTASGHWSPVVSDDASPPSGPSLSSGEPGVGGTSNERLQSHSHESRRDET